MNKLEFRKLIREEIRKAIKEAASPQVQAIKLAVQTALNAGDDDELYDNSAAISYKKLAKKTGLSEQELQHIVLYCMDLAGQDVSWFMDNLDAKAAGGGGLTGKQLLVSIRKKLQQMGTDYKKLI